jgi:hypothetical protein
MPIKASITKKIAAGIHIGDSTHHHDQAILPSNLRAINKIHKSPAKPIPPEVVLESLIMLFFYYHQNIPPHKAKKNKARKVYPKIPRFHA